MILPSPSLPLPVKAQISGLGGDGAPASFFFLKTPHWCDGVVVEALAWEVAVGYRQWCPCSATCVDVGTGARRWRCSVVRLPGAVVVFVVPSRQPVGPGHASSGVSDSACRWRTVLRSRTRGQGALFGGRDEWRTGWLGPRGMTERDNPPAAGSTLAQPRRVLAPVRRGLRCSSLCLVYSSLVSGSFGILYLFHLWFFLPFLFFFFGLVVLLTPALRCVNGGWLWNTKQGETLFR